MLGAFVLLAPTAPSATAGQESTEEDADLLGAHGGLGAGGPSGGGPGARLGDRLGHDAGAGGADAGEGVPEPLADSDPAGPGPAVLVPARELPPSVTFATPRTVEDEYDSATMVWQLVEARREQVRAALAEARRTGDQEQSARLAHQLELLEIGDRRMEAIVSEVESRRTATTPAVEEPPPSEVGEGASPE